MLVVDVSPDIKRLPPTLKFLVIATPPEVTILPFVKFVDSVVSVTIIPLLTFIFPVTSNA